MTNIVFDTFGSSGIYTPPNGNPATVLMVLNEKMEPIGDEDGSIVLERITEIHVRSSDLSHPKRNAIIQFLGKTYKVEGVDSDDSYVVKMIVTEK